MIFTDLHFIRPLALLALPVVLFIIWYMQHNGPKDDGWAKICDSHLLDAIKVNKGGKGSRWSLMLWPISIIAILAISGPAFRKLPTPVIKNQSALVIALDVSRSMLADDIKPNRLERAKFKINDILANRNDGQTALIVYSGDAFVVTPLTDDTETIALMLKAIHPDIMPVQGSRVDIALSKSQDLLQQAGYLNGDVLLICDSVNSSRADSLAERLQDKNITTSVLAVGTEDGAPVKYNRGFIKDKNGNIVIPKLQVKALRQLVTSGNGRFAQISGDSSDIEYLIPSVHKDNNLQSKDTEETADTEKYIDEGPWLNLLLLPLVALLFRKGLLLALFLVVGLQTPQVTYAFGWNDLWLNSDQQAVKEIKQGKNQQAFIMAKSDDWKATAAFRNKDYIQAQNLYNDGSADGFYNQGNSLAAGGKLEDAIKAYDQALKISPNDEDTLYNKEQVEQAIKKQQEQQQEKKNKDDKENKDQQKQDKENQEKQDKENQEKQDQQNKDGEKQEGEQEQQNQEQQDNPDQQEQEQQSDEMTKQEKKEQEAEKKKLDEADKKEQEQQEKLQQEVKMTPKELAEEAENKEAIEQWLRRIPDDPGGLLRRKFYYQYNQQNKKPDESEDW